MSTDHGIDPSPEITAKDNAGAPPAAAAGADPAAPPAPQPAGTPAAGEPYRPQGLAEHLFGASDRETIDKLTTAYSGARAELAKGQPTVPKAGEYVFNWSDAVKGQGGIAKDDQAVSAFAEIAHEHGFTQKQIDAIPKFFDKMVEKGLIDTPADPAKLLEDLAPAEFRGPPEEKRQRGSQRLATAETWIKQLDTARGFDDDMKQELRLLTTTPAGVRVVETLMKTGLNPSVSAGGGGAPSGPISKADLDARVSDPRNDSTRHDKFDPAFAEETRKLFKSFYS